MEPSTGSSYFKPRMEDILLNERDPLETSMSEVSALSLWWPDTGHFNESDSSVGVLGDVANV